MTDEFSLIGKTAVITGGLGLLGSAIAEKFEKHGAKIIILDIKSNNKFDVTDIDYLPKMIQDIFEKNSKIDIWVNAAYPRTEKFGFNSDSKDPKSFEKNVQMHLNSYSIISKEVCEEMKSRNIEGSIINLSSIYGLVAPDFTIYEGTDMTVPYAYPVIKAGVIASSKYCASLYGKDKIRVNTICAGGIFNNQDSKFVEKYSNKTLLKRMGQPKDIANTAVFLASEASSYITGTEIIVDGGWTVR